MISFEKKGNHVRNKNLEICFKIYVYILYSFETIHSIYTSLKDYRNKAFRELLFINYGNLPCETTVYNLIKRKSELEKIRNELRKKIVKNLINNRNIRIVVMDMTDLPKYVRDELANYGYCSKGKFFGYKLHLVSTKDGIPLAFCVSQANKRESVFTFRLFSDLKAIIGDLKIKYVIGDRGYDSNNCHNEGMNLLKTQLIAPFNKRKSKVNYKRPLSLELRKKLRKRGKQRDINGLLYYSEEGKRLYKNKVMIEQLNDELKNDWNFINYFQYIKGNENIENEITWFILLLTLSKFYNKIMRNKICNQLTEVML